MLRIFLAALPRFALFLLALIPVLIGAGILMSLQQGTLNTFTEPADLIRRAGYSWAVTAHIIGGSTMLIAGFAQFSTRLRRAFPALHRWSGRLLILLGVFFALSGLWMNFSAHAAPGSTLQNAAQNLVAVLFLATLWLGIAAIRRRDIARHRVWMVRAYALTLGAATQTVLLLPVFLLLGEVEGLAVDLTFIAAWLVNLAVAEIFVLRQRPVRMLSNQHATGPV